MSCGKDDGMQGWRTAVISEKSSLTVMDARLVVTGKQTSAIPLEQLRQVLVTSGTSLIDVRAMTEAASEHVHWIFCGEKYTPVCEVVPIGQHHEAAGAVIDQAEWKSERKDEIWKVIVEAKLRNQLSLLREKGKEPPPRFLEYGREVEPGDRTNREAMAARLYFTSLFGHEFRRGVPGSVNSKLNYGYTILCSAFTRTITVHGYHTGLGIHHCSRDNPVNLSSDLMEPFRPAVDRMVFESGDKELDWDLKKQFIALPYRSVVLDGKTTTLEEAIDVFTVKTLEAVKQGKSDIPEVAV